MTKLFRIAAALPALVAGALAIKLGAMLAIVPPVPMYDSLAQTYSMTAFCCGVMAILLGHFTCTGKWVPYVVAL